MKWEIGDYVAYATSQYVDVIIGYIPETGDYKLRTVKVPDGSLTLVGQVFKLDLNHVPSVRKLTPLEIQML